MSSGGGRSQLQAETARRSTKALSAARGGGLRAEGERQLCSLGE